MVATDVLSIIRFPIIERVQLHHQIREGQGNESRVLVRLPIRALACDADGHRVCLDFDGFLGVVGVQLDFAFGSDPMFLDYEAILELIDWCHQEVELDLLGDMADDDLPPPLEEPVLSRAL